MKKSYKHLRILSIRFDLSLRYEELSMFRGAIVHLPREKNDFCYNHSDATFFTGNPEFNKKNLLERSYGSVLKDPRRCLIFARSHERFIVGTEQIKLKIKDVKAHHFKVGV